MAASCHNLLATSAVLLLSAAPVAAQELPILLNAASTDYDRRNQRILFEQISIERGGLGIAAQQAESSQLDFADSTWVFRGNVRIHSDESEVTASVATMRFVEHQLQSATITGAPAVLNHQGDATVKVNAESADVSFADNEVQQVILSGSPATFRHARRSGEVELTRGQANRLQYDIEAARIQLSGNAWVSQGENEIRGADIVYDIAAERVIAGGDQADDRVRIIITPPTTDNQ